MASEVGRGHSKFEMLAWSSSRRIGLVHEVPVLLEMILKLQCVGPLCSTLSYVVSFCSTSVVETHSRFACFG